MKNLTNKTYRKAGIVGILSLFLFLAYSCKESLTDVNTNENEPTEAATSYLMTNAQKDLADNYWGEFPLGYFGSYYAQYWSSNQYTEESQYQYRPGVVNNIWDVYYETMLSLQQIIEQNRNNPNVAAAYGNNANQIAAAQILKAWTFQTITDIWGSAPYTEALQGAENASPAYDSQEKIYSSLIDTLESARDAIVEGEPVFNSGDIIFDGDATKWKRFANALIMRLAIREADAATEEAKDAFQKAYQSGAMQSNDDNALFVYLSDSPNNNPMNEAYKTRDDFAVSETLMGFMNDHNDPRRGAYAEPAVNDGNQKYSGFPYGMKGSDAKSYKNNEPWSRPSERVREATAPAIFMTYSEVLFNEAEAAERDWISADPAQKYEEAIRASMEYWDVSSSDAETYISNNPYQPNKWRQNLGRQKWVALYMQGIQGWSVERRLDFGLFVPPQGGKLGVSFDTQNPVRYPYPTQEHNLNGENVDAAIQAQGFSEDDQGQRLWWDKEAEGK